jgi:hypothetical protein
LKEKEDWILILKKKIGQDQQDLWIIQPSAERPLAAGEKIPDNPDNPDNPV